MLLIDDIKKYDASDMFSVLKDFPEQMEKAVALAEKFIGFTSKNKSTQNVLIIGMGGSAMGGDVVKDYFEFSGVKNKIRVTVSRGYDIPQYVDEKTLVICSSYSGNTEETLEAAAKAFAITKKVACITSGGKLSEFAKENGLPVLEIPGGLQPREALGYSVVSMLYMLLNSGLLAKTEVKKATDDIANTIQVVKVLAENFVKFEEPNIAVTVAEMLKDSMVMVYSSEKFYAANLRWRCQLQENCKMLAFGSMIPEMNHNEINGFERPADVISKSTIVVFNDDSDHPRIKQRIEALKEVIDDRISTVVELTASESDYLPKLFEYMYLGDWVSYYMAMMLKIDPTPIPVIQKFKTMLSEPNKEN